MAVRARRKNLSGAKWPVALSVALCLSGLSASTCRAASVWRWPVSAAQA